MPDLPEAVRERMAKRVKQLPFSIAMTTDDGSSSEEEQAAPDGSTCCKPMRRIGLLLAGNIG